MELHLPADLEARLSSLARQRGQSDQELILEALARMIDHDRWFAAQVAEGMTAADRGRTVPHEDVASLIQKRYPA